MAVIHRATLTPSKLELLEPWLARQPWAGTGGNLERLGSYRFDDPDGEVGIEGFLLRHGTETVHVLLTYRAAPLEGAAEWLIGTMEHSVLGTRWVYDGVGDPVGRDVLLRALRGEQQQAALEVHDDAGAVVQRPEPDVRVRTVVADDVGAAAPASVSAEDGFAVAGSGEDRLLVARIPSVSGPSRRRLVATWADGEAVIAALG
ncbi:CG0192-related protein [Arthrobacter sp. RAF14]|uniref:CG0192-related protein n=1 Tax=Arthrobacter sp. RAF14 TaxID=3233051 RepID=UPI003F8E6B51